MWRVWVLVLSILVWSSGSVNGNTNTNDSSALRVMYSSLNSPSQLTGWSSNNGGDPCGQSWKGVTCSGSAVTEIKLSGLGLSGTLGYQLSSLSSLTILDVSNNNLGNQLPYQLPPNVQQLNFARNSFSGGLPYSISSMTSLKYLNISHNQINGQLDDMFGQLSAITTLDFSYNTLTGNLPQSFSSLSSVTTMNLQNNQFTGPINVLANLPLQYLNVQNNGFSGWIPNSLKHVPNFYYGGNPWSNGPAPPPPPYTSPPSRHSNTNSPPSNGGNSGIGGGGIAGIVISVLVVGAVVAFFLVKKRSRRTVSDVEKLDNDRPFTPLVSDNVKEVTEKSIPPSSITDSKAVETSALNLRPPPIKSFDEDDLTIKPIVVNKATTTPINAKMYSIADLQMATDSFNVENLIGEGSIGRVYQAQFDDGKVLAVKKIDSSVLSSQASEDFIEVVSNMARLHHTNVTELVGYCSEHGQHLLVYEFHKNGSLHDFLHLSDEYSKPLTWNTRVKIALGTARALEYLHEVCSPPVVHNNLKSANILLDMELNPHLSDCGLTNFIANADQVLNHNTRSGYTAPEVALSGQYATKSDIYSFGVIMLELLTGRKPFDSSRPRSEQSLVQWATPQLHDIDALSKMVDPALEGLYPVKSLSRFADVVALCVQGEPEFRPPMSEVVEALVRLVQRANMSKRTTVDEQGRGRRADDAAMDE